MSATDPLDKSYNEGKGDLSHDLRKDNNFKLKLPLYGFDTGSVLLNAVL